MNHDLIKNDLSALCDGELSASRRGEVEAHLLTCAECRSFYENWKAVSTALFARRPEPASSDFFVRQVMDKIEIPAVCPQKTWIPVQWFAPSVGIAAMLLLALVPSQTVSSAELLFVNGEDAQSQWMLSGASPKSDEVLSFILEEK